MLTRKEEIDVSKILYTAREELEEFKTVSDHIGLEDIILLCTRLKDINNELKHLESLYREYVKEGYARDALLKKLNNSIKSLSEIMSEAAGEMPL